MVPREVVERIVEAKASGDLFNYERGVRMYRLVESSDPDQVNSHQVRAHYTQRLVLTAAGGHPSTNRSNTHSACPISDTFLAGSHSAG